MMSLFENEFYVIVLFCFSGPTSVEELFAEWSNPVFEATDKVGVQAIYILLVQLNIVKVPDGKKPTKKHFRWPPV